MAEELRFFVRSLLYLAPVTLVYWLVSAEPAGTALLLALVVAMLALVGIAAYLAPSAVGDLRPTGEGGPLATVAGWVNRAIGFHEPTEDTPPMQAGSQLVPLGSPWPIIAAAAAVIVGLGLIFGAWLLLPGLVLVAAAVLGWITQLDRA